MAYSLYQVQGANAWKQRCLKENFVFENSKAAAGAYDLDDGASSVAGTSFSNATSSGSTSTRLLKDRIRELEASLTKEVTARKGMEKAISTLKRQMNSIME